LLELPTKRIPEHRGRAKIIFFSIGPRQRNTVKAIMNEKNLPDRKSRVAVLLPARRVDAALAPLVEELLATGIGAIILVDDGCPAEDKPALDLLARRERVYLERHAVNLGKGRALKTGMNFFLTAFPEFCGLVTADTDGQHCVADIVRVIDALLSAPNRAVLGCRSFAGNVPLRSRFGNLLTRTIFHFVSGHWVSDTQTGLRAFPRTLVPELVALSGERYEYEMTVLAYLCRHAKVPIEVPISTIYIDDNRSSQFNPVRDSMRIYFVLVRFYASSLISSGLDLAGFSVTYWLTRNILLSVVVGRTSSLVNFALNRGLVFHNHSSIRGSIWRYYLLAAVLGAISYSAIRGLSGWLGWNMVAIKMLVESLLSLASFSVQRTLVFARGSNEQSE
jgi:glycosyltransferase involved in cell wall biosynthesis